MAITKPVYRTYRPSTGSAYIEDPRYATDALHYIKAFLLIQKDLLQLFDYIEPSDINLNTYSFRIHELLIRSCIEVEANFKAIFLANNYPHLKPKDWNIISYSDLNQTHKLSSYRIVIPNWHGKIKSIVPFASFKKDDLKLKSPYWYKAYNETKHDRHEKFTSATLKNLMGAVTGLLAVLSSQFYTNDFSSSNPELCFENPMYENTEEGIGGYFRVQFPIFPKKDCYDCKNSDLTSPGFNLEPYGN
ncbi:Uncharacterised protein [Legionella donaldsonii]|uniref:Uncharacterized protein n=1 Tax=Legionella donaldsonii TaxID=45060 RepID=A0A378J269_9GAMM|nr:hypothetical protein [Legionella donaldsonii]STX41496.1 Uncharacterised protein [Legionella donaldsonii]